MVKCSFLVEPRYREGIDHAHVRTKGTPEEDKKRKEIERIRKDGVVEAFFC